MRTVLVLLTSALLTSAAAPAPIDRYGITAEEHAACDVDAINLCGDAIPDVDRTLACMKRKVDSLTSTCATVLKAGLKRRRIPL